MTQIGIIMGSNSDWPVMRQAAQFLEEFGVEYEARVVSAHRTPDLMFQYAETARSRGISAIIAGAGGAAHLPGMVAAKTTVPVLGVPVPSKYMSGEDSLLSIVQMPKAYPSPHSPSASRRSKCSIVRRFHAGQRKPRTGAKTGRLPSQTGTG